MKQIPCPLCGQHGTTETGGATETKNECPRCGTYILMSSALIGGIPDRLKKALSCATRQTFERNGPLVLDSETMENLASAHLNSTVVERAELCLRHVAAKSPYPGGHVKLHIVFDYPVADAVSSDELVFYIKFLINSGLLEGVWDNASSWNCTVTVQGWQHISSTNTTWRGTPFRCFTALQINARMKDIYISAIQPAIEAAGFQSFCMVNIHENDCIRDRILSEIRQSGTSGCRFYRAAAERLF